jgi:drug/metabolite transporter (DMT)-like permease
MNTITVKNTNQVSRLYSFILPFFFVVLYGSGFVGAKYGLPFSSPLSFLSLRFIIAGLILFAVVKTMKVKLPSLLKSIQIAISGSLTVGLFSIGVFVSIDMGLSPSLSALIIALQPILVAIFAKSFIGEQLTLVQWLGLALGLLGVTLVVGHNIDLESGLLGLASVGMSILGLLGLSIGSLYQKKYCADMNIYVGGMIQSLVSGLICIGLLPFYGGYSVEWSPEFIGALLFMSIGVSIGALSLLYLMISAGDVSKVASVFYLVPVSAAIPAYFFFGETFDIFTLSGACVVALGVFLTNRKQ